MGNPVALLLKGPEVPLPRGYSFKDFKGHERSEVRLKWWSSAEGSLRDVVLSVPDVEDIPEVSIPAEIRDILYPEHEPPVFCGHYKMRGTPEISSSNAVCLELPGGSMRLPLGRRGHVNFARQSGDRVGP
ncbi:MAG: hypothetical protein RDA78_01785 [Roseibium sp.]|uniref:hypothetical protein n=1 Tax=Roseibium sp. TaxID=1936156 RepID=UPI003D9C5DE8